ncbi:hypothetical protein FF36_04401 [Frankia torreyi]|uniref:Uncharacterized protein n=1 Tax=Frankia torreyi TaxID=1856 RepID=A0A0D8BD04_9ACTN|nr:hypothetical protein FF36_04401 [Frankia torreyi]KQM03356.1 hypothetical protein FF86_104238 [Frankia sp. CpI1-P]
MILKRTLSMLALFLAAAAAFALFPAAAQARPLGGARVYRPGVVTAPHRVYRPGAVYIPPRVYRPGGVYRPGVRRR